MLTFGEQYAKECQKWRTVVMWFPLRAIWLHSCPLFSQCVDKFPDILQLVVPLHPAHISFNPCPRFVWCKPFLSEDELPMSLHCINSFLSMQGHI